MDIFSRERGSYRFGAYRLDPTLRALLRDGERVKIAERLFDTLLYLVVNHGRLVERDELLHAVWGGRAVEENNLAQAIHALRRILHSSDAAQRYIVTTPGRGYRFTGHVVFEPDAEPDADVARYAPERNPAGPAQAAHPFAARRRAIVAIAAAAVILIGIGLAGRRLIGPAADERAARRAVFAPPAHSVAVLAFENMTGDPGQAYFSDGLAEELIDSLSRLGAIQVAARTSAFSFKGSHATITDIAAKLNVGAVLEGSVQRAGERLRIAVDLVDARSGLQIWSRTYDRDRGKDDLLTVQGDIAAAVAAALEVRLAGDDAARLTAGGTHDPRALDAYLHGAMATDFMDDARSRAAIVDFDTAIAADPDYALAYIGRAAARDYIASSGEPVSADDRKAELAAALADVDRALVLAPMLPKAHLRKAEILLDTLDFRGELAELERAVDLSPGSAEAQSRFGAAEGMMGHFDRALPAVRRAIVLDPLASRTYRALARVLFWQKNFAGSIDAYRQADALDARPSFSKRDEVALVDLAMGQADAARGICQTGGGWMRGECLAIADHALGLQADARGVVDRLEQDYGDTLAYNYAEIYAQWNEPELAIHWLQVAYKLRDAGLCELLVAPFLDPIRQRPEFKVIQASLNFPPAR